MEEKDSDNGTKETNSKNEKNEKKEKVLHTRVSETLDEELRRRANGLGVTVSNLVRNVLLNAFEMVEEIVADTTNVANAVRGKEAAQPESSGAEPLGWQELVLNVNAVCRDCNAIIARGSRGAAAIREGGPTREFLCPDCLGRIGSVKEKSDG